MAYATLYGSPPPTMIFQPPLSCCWTAIKRDCTPSTSSTSVRKYLAMPCDAGKLVCITRWRYDAWVSIPVPGTPVSALTTDKSMVAGTDVTNWVTVPGGTAQVPDWVATSNNCDVVPSSPTMPPS